MSEFYVGYLPQAPPGLARSVRRIVLGLVAASVLTALVLVFWQARFPASVFEFQQYRDFEGTLREHPYPNLAVAPAMPGYLLVAPGKHGAAELVAGFDDRAVRLKGSLIYRDGARMLELVPNSVRASGNSPIPAPHAIDLGMTTLSGEIVDSKCYLGVMNPGNGKVHRDCAARCISGGIPPVFVVKDAEGVSRTLLLNGSDGLPIGRAVLDFVAEPVVVSGRLSRSGDTLILESDPGSIHRVNK